MAALFAQIGERWGGLDVLCANAGIAGPTAPVEEVALDDWRACLCGQPGWRVSGGEIRRPDDEGGRDRVR